MNSSAKSRPPSIAVVARHAHVAPSTVSAVWNGRGGVSEATRQTVLQAIKELGYRPLPGGRPRTPRPDPVRANRIALLTVGISRAHLNSPVYMDVLHGIETAVRENGFGFMLTQSPDTQSLPAAFLCQKVDGVLLFGYPCEAPIADRLRSLPCVRTMGLVNADEWWDHVTYANQRIGAQAAAYLLDRGHRHAAIVVPKSESNPIYLERHETFQKTMVANGGECLDLVDPQLTTDLGAVEQARPERVSLLLDALQAARPRPTGVFLVADMLAVPFYTELLRRGLAPGQELDIVSCNNESPLLVNLHPRPATFDIHAEKIGHRAVKQLLWRIENPGEPRVVQTLEPTLVRMDE